MNRSNFLKKRVFPLESERLDEMQETYREVADAMAKYFDDFTIISGMKNENGTITDGYFVVGGKDRRIIKFKKSSLQEFIQIKKENVSVTATINDKKERFDEVYYREWGVCVSKPDKDKNNKDTEHYYFDLFKYADASSNGEKEYSFEEQWTGKYWMNGEKIYWKTLDFGRISSSKYLSNPIPNIKLVVKVEGFGCDTHVNGAVVNHIQFQPRLENSYYPYYKAPYSYTTFPASFSFGATFKVTNFSAEITYAANEGGRSQNYLTVYYTKL